MMFHKIWELRTIETYPKISYYFPLQLQFFAISASKSANFSLKTFDYICGFWSWASCQPIYLKRDGINCPL